MGAWAVLAPARDAAGGTVELTSPTGNKYTLQVTSSNTNFVSLNPGNGGAESFDVVILGDGYTASAEDQARLTRAAKVFVDNLFLVSPYLEFKSCINVWLVNLISPQTGIDDPDQTPPYVVTTALDCSFKTGSMEITGNLDKAEEVCSLAGVACDAIYVLVNDRFDHNGSWALYAQDIAFSSDKFPWGTIMAHELGHVVARLADEYRYPDCGQAEEFVTYTAGLAGFEIPEPNVTDAEDIALVPWKNLLETETFPTTIDSVCSGETIGRWEGGRWLCFGIYRPRQYCLMDGVTCDNPDNDDFCPVCSRAISDSLSILYGCSP